MKKNIHYFNHLAVVAAILGVMAMGCIPEKSSTAGATANQEQSPEVKCSDFKTDPAACNAQAGVCEFYDGDCLTVSDAKVQKDLSQAIDNLEKNKIKAQTELDKIAHDAPERTRAQAKVNIITNQQKYLKTIKDMSAIEPQLSKDYEFIFLKRDELDTNLNAMNASLNIFQQHQLTTDKQEIDNFIKFIENQRKEVFSHIDKEINKIKQIASVNEPKLRDALTKATTKLADLEKNVALEKARLPLQAGVHFSAMTSINGIEGVIKQAKASMAQYNDVLEDTKFSDEETANTLQAIAKIEQNIVAGNKRLIEVMDIYNKEVAKAATTTGGAAVSAQEKQAFKTQVEEVKTKFATGLHSDNRIKEVTTLITNKAGGSYSIDDWKEFFNAITDGQTDLEKFFIYDGYLAPQSNEHIEKNNQLKFTARFYQKIFGESEAKQKFPNVMLHIVLEDIDVGSDYLKQYCKEIAQFSGATKWYIIKDADLNNYDTDMQTLYAYLQSKGFNLKEIIDVANTLIRYNNWGLSEKLFFDRLAIYQSAQTNHYPLSYLTLFTKTLMDRLYKDGSEQELVDNLAIIKISGATMTNFLAGLVDNAHFAKIESPLREALKKYNLGFKADKDYIQGVAGNNDKWNGHKNTAREIAQYGNKSKLNL